MKKQNKILHKNMTATNHQKTDAKCAQIEVRWGNGKEQKIPVNIVEEKEKSQQTSSTQTADNTNQQEQKTVSVKKERGLIRQFVMDSFIPFVGLAYSLPRVEEGAIMFIVSVLFMIVVSWKMQDGILYKYRFNKLEKEYFDLVDTALEGAGLLAISHIKNMRLTKQLDEVHQNKNTHKGRGTKNTRTNKK